MTWDKYTCDVGDPILRREYIGSSDASAIMGVSPWDTPLTLWETKLGLRLAKNLNFAMARGIELEQNARDHINQLTGYEFHPKRIFSENFPWMMANLDGLSTCGKYSVEIKCPGVKDHAIAQAGMVPEKYIPQLQHQMIVSGHKSMFYMSYHPEGSAVVEVPSDVDYQLKLIEAEEKFYEQLKSFEEPGKSLKDYAKKTDAAWIHEAQKYCNIHDTMRQLDAQLYDCRMALLEMAGGNNCEGCGIKVTKSARKGAIQYDRIPEIQHVDLDYYRLPPSEIWKISFDMDCIKTPGEI